MPDEQTLAKVYGADYVQGHDEAKNPGRVIDWLRTASQGTFVDYGCGEGHLLIEAQRLGWSALGVEYNRQVARRTAERTGVTVVTDPTQQWPTPVADVLHLGDVIEHLTSLEQQMPAILALVKPGGVVVAQGPLEANAHLFLLAVKAARRLRPRRTEMPPMHVILATSLGQKTLFSRFGLTTIRYEVSETAWPAPASLSTLDLSSTRQLALYATRRLSQAVTRVHRGEWGNRYFYVGRLGGGGGQCLP